MKTEREKITGKVAAAALRLAGEPYTLEPGEENCYLLLGAAVGLLGFLI